MKKFTPKRLKLLVGRRGASAVTAVIILFVCVIIFAFIFELYSLYTISTNVHNCFERSIKTITALNEIYVYENLRENVMELAEDDLDRLITLDELKASVCEELGLVENDMGLYRMNKNGDGFSYCINSLEFEHIYYDSTDTLCFEAKGKIEVPLGIMGGNVGRITLGLNVKSVYGSKLRTDR